MVKNSIDDISSFTLLIFISLSVGIEYIELMRIFSLNVNKTNKNKEGSNLIVLSYGFSLYCDTSE